MKIRNLLLVGMCLLSMGAFAQGTVIYTESFGTNTYHRGTANTSGEFKAGSSFYFDDYLFIHNDYSGATTRTWPNASEGSVLGMGYFANDGGIDSRILRIKLNTESYIYATFSFAVCWDDGIQVSYSTNGGTEWTQMDKATANSKSYEPWFLYEYKENLGGKANLILKIEYQGTGTPQMDDPTVIGYTTIPADKFALNAIIGEADNFISGEGMDAKYCFDDVLAFTNNDAYTAATTVRDDEDATQAEVDAATLGLTTAFNALKATALDFSELEASIAAAEEYAADPHVVAPLAEANRLVETGTLPNFSCAAQSDLEAAKAVLDQAVIDAISVDGVAAGTFGLYPNPANDFIRIDGIENGTVYIFDATGKQMLSVAGYNGEDINITTLSPGVYTAAYGKTAISFIKE